MKNCEKNREAVSSVGDLVEALYMEVASMPLSDVAKNALVMVMLGDILKREGQCVSFQFPPDLEKSGLAA